MNNKVLKIIMILLLFISFNLDLLSKNNELNTTNMEKIGILFNPLTGWQYNDFSFSDDGNFLYTYRNKSLYIWKFLPEIKYISSTYIGIAKNKKNTSFMHMLSNHKIIFRTSHYIELWDLNVQKKIVEKKIKSISGVIVNDEFVTLDKDKILKKLGLDKLEVISEGYVPNHCIGFEMENTEIFDCKCSSLIYANNTINVVCQYYISCIELDALRESNYSYFNPTYSYLSLDEKKIYSPLVGKIINQSDCKQKKLQENKYFLSREEFKGKKTFIFKLFLVKEKKFSNELKVFKIYTINKDKQKKKSLGYFLHDIDGNWIFRKGSYFDTSLSYRELKMKLADGKVSTMNPLTYKKYHKKINFNDIIDAKH